MRLAASAALRTDAGLFCGCRHPTIRCLCNSRKWPNRRQSPRLAGGHINCGTQPVGLAKDWPAHSPSCADAHRDKQTATPESAIIGFRRTAIEWVIDSGPSVVVVSRDVAVNLNSTMLTQDVYAYPFGEHGLMAGLGLEGSKITGACMGCGVGNARARSVAAIAAKSFILSLPNVDQLETVSRSRARR